jgi:FtsZ-interacting cell division protein ZipA
MSTIGWIIVLVVVLVLLAVVVAAMMRNRKHEQRRAQAGQLRQEAASRSDEIARSEQEARAAEARAEAARLEAQRAEEQATEARRGVEMDQAHQEDRIREANRVDPDDKRF